MTAPDRDPRLSFRDHFSEVAARYAKRRPVYPPELAQFLASLAPGRELAWDAGCGSGQMSALLAEHFDLVVATDASAEQLAHATRGARIEFRCERAERTSLADASVDLIVSAQAAHWFDLPAFYAEVRRVAREGAVLALVCYSNLRIDDELDRVIERFYAGPLGPHWPPERALVDNGYRSIVFPFDEMREPIPTDAQWMHAAWNFHQTLGYISTWSAVRALEQNGDGETFADFSRDLAAAWGSLEAPRDVRWPLVVRLARLGDAQHLNAK